MMFYKSQMPHFIAEAYTYVRSCNINTSILLMLMLWGCYAQQGHGWHKHIVLTHWLKVFCLCLSLCQTYLYWTQQQHNHNQETGSKIIVQQLQIEKYLISWSPPSIFRECKAQCGHLILLWVASLYLNHVTWKNKQAKIIHFQNILYCKYYLCSSCAGYNK